MNIDFDQSARASVERVLCEKDHLFFTRRFFKPRMGFKFSVNWHHVYISEKLDALLNGTAAKKNIVFNVPPGSGKTELCGGNLVSHGLAINPRARFLYLSYSEDLVSDVLATAKNIVGGDEFQSLWKIDLASDSSAKRNWKTEIDGFYAGHAYGASLGGQITGRRAGVLGLDGFTGLLVVDDPLKPEDAFSPALRKKAVRKLINTVQSRKAHPDVPVVMIMQRLHEDDPTGAVLTGAFTGDWEVITIPALIDDAYIATLPEHIQKLVPRDVPRDEQGRQSYWTEKEDLNFLLQLEHGGHDKDGAAVSRYTFSSQYMQQPKKLGGGMIKSEWFGRYQKLPLLKWRATWVDTAFKTNEWNDWSVFLTGGLGYDGNLYITDVKRGRWEAPQLIKSAESVLEQHKPSNTEIGSLRYMSVEDKASGTGLIQAIRKNKLSVPIKAVERNTDKLTRFMDIQLYLEQGRVFVPYHAPWLSEFLAECEAFKADMTHDFDDQVDCLIDAINDTVAKKASVFD